MNKLLSEKFTSVFKPVLTELHNTGSDDDKQLAELLLKKIKTVKNNYSIDEIEPLLELNKKDSSFTL